MAPTGYWAPPMRTDVASEPERAGDPHVVPTPASVPDVTPSICLSLVEFKDMLRQFRAVDDGVTLRLNRAFAQSRDTGSSAPPSLLQRHDKSFSSSSATDLGRTTYASVPDTMCAAIWTELVQLWTRREDTIKYCIDVNAKHMPRPLSRDDRLDLDRTQAAASAPATAVTRGESDAEFTMRQLRNELAIEAIVRRRSLDVFKSRCRLFSPAHTEREQAYWRGY